jgi:ferredoxin-NADP reductase
MIAGGSGITPVISILETVLYTRPELSIALIYGNRSERDIVFHERLERLARAYPDRLAIDHVLSDPSEAWTGPRGILDPSMLAARLDAIGSDAPRYYYLCGPTAMMDGANELLRAHGVAHDRIREERFHSPGAAVPTDLPDHVVVARMRVRGRSHIVPVAPGKTLLEAGLAAGVDLPFSCAMGGCAACKVRRVSGEVHREESCLSDRERAEGHVLACSARPRGPVSIEVAR